MPLENRVMPFEIAFSNLWTYEGGNSDKRLPLSRLSERGGHIHGLLQIKIDGRLLPYLGYFGPDDVCFNEWIFELKSAVKILAASATASYTYDEGEQGQPAFLFERNGNVAFVSVVASQLSDTEGDPDWQRVQFSFADFKRNVEQFLVQLQQHITAASSQFGRHWWEHVAERAA
jgi:hypothetical protein